MRCLFGFCSVNSNVQLLLLDGDNLFGGLTKLLLFLRNICNEVKIQVTFGTWDSWAGELGDTELFDWNCCHFIELGWRRRRAIMAEGEERIELKFRIYDGTDIAHTTYPPSTTIATLKQRLVADWPQDKSVVPKSASDIKLIHCGKVLENSNTVAESRMHFGDLPGGVITIHVVVQPPVAKKKIDKSQEEMSNKNTCSCTIL